MLGPVEACWGLGVCVREYCFEIIIFLVCYITKSGEISVGKVKAVKHRTP